MKDKGDYGIQAKWTGLGWIGLHYCGRDDDSEGDMTYRWDSAATPSLSCV